MNRCHFSCVPILCRAEDSLEAFDTSLPQLEFIRVFVDSHIERAIGDGTACVFCAASVFSILMFLMLFRLC